MKTIWRLPFQRFAASIAPRPMLAIQHSHRTFCSRFSEEHEWVKKTEGTEDGAIIGITDYAQDSLGEIVFVEFPDVGDEYTKGDVFGQIESVKAASELYMPLDGEVIEVNERLTDEPGLVNSSPEKDGWMIKIKMKDTSQFDGMMNTAKYKEYTENLN
eukprot:180316_1